MYDVSHTQKVHHTQIRVWLLEKSDPFCFVQGKNFHSEILEQGVFSSIS